MHPRTRNWLIFIVFLVVVTLLVDLSSVLPGTDIDITPKLGLDLSGGTQVLLEANAAQGAQLTSESMGQTLRIIENRVNASGLTEPLVQQAGTNRVLVELPNEKDPARAVSTIQQTGLLEWVEAGSQFFPEGAIIRTSLSPTPTQVLTGSLALTQTIDDTIWPTLFTGAELETDANSLGITQDQRGAPAVAFTLKSEAAQLFGDYTAANVGGYLCIVLDNVVQSCPVINSAIPGGRGTITVGSGGLEEAQSLLTLLRYGALPVSLTVVQSRTIGPTLGTESINDSVLAGAIGLAAVALFMVLYYRLPGVLAVLALILYTMTLFALFKLIPVTLTLPGIAGFILSIGVAVDANVLIFERMKEELRRGRKLTVAVDIGFDRAWPSIRDSNISTLITCAILFWFGSAFGASIVKGFAITLALGVLVSLFTSIRVTRTFLQVTTHLRDFETHKALFGV
jgi:preprotein translocase subunit SecD